MTGRRFVTRRMTTVLVAIATLALLVAGCDWNQPFFDAAHTSDNAREPTLTAAALQHMTAAWSCRSCGMDAVVGNTVYSAFSSPNPPFGNGTATAVDATTGVQEWTRSLDGVTASLRGVGNGLVYMFTGHLDATSDIVALDAATGAVKWTLVPPAQPGVTPQYLITAVSGEVAFGVENLRDPTNPIGGGTSNVIAVDTAGHIAWSQPVGSDVTDVAVAGDTVVAYSVDDATQTQMTLTRFAAADGTPRGAVTATANDGQGHVFAPTSPLTLANGLAYVRGTYTIGNAFPGALVAIDPTTGAIAWQHIDDVRDFAVTPSAVVEVTHEAGPGGLIARNPTTGALLWTSDVPAAVNTLNQVSSPDVVVAGDLVYEYSPYLAVRSLADGSDVTTFALPGLSVQKVIPSNGAVYMQAAGVVKFVPAS